MKIEEISKKTYRRFADNEMKQFFDDSFDRKQKAEFWSAYSHEGKRICFAAKEGTKTIGAVSVDIEYKVAKLGVFIVSEKYRNSGIGSHLLDKCEDLAKKNKCKKIWLFTLPTIKAFRFYKKRGYIEEGRLRKQFGGRDASIMSKFF